MCFQSHTLCTSDLLPSPSRLSDLQIQVSFHLPFLLFFCFLFHLSHALILQVLLLIDKSPLLPAGHKPTCHQILQLPLQPTLKISNSMLKTISQTDLKQQQWQYVRYCLQFENPSLFILISKCAYLLEIVKYLLMDRIDRAQDPLRFNSPPPYFQHQPPYGQPSHNISFPQVPRFDHRPQFSNIPQRAPPSQPTQSKHQTHEPNRQKVKDMTDELSRLKQQLHDIMANSSAQKLRAGNIGNKSSDNLFAPNARAGEFKVPFIHLEENGYDYGRKNHTFTKEHQKVPHTEKEKPRNYERELKAENSQREISNVLAKETPFPSQPSAMSHAKNDKKFNFYEEKQEDKRVAMLENPNRKEAARRDSLPKERPAENFNSSRSLETSTEIRNFKYEMEKVKTQMQSKIDTLTLENSNLVHQNDNLKFELEKSKAKLVDNEEKRKTAEAQTLQLRDKQRDLEIKIKKLEEKSKEKKSNEKRDSFDHVLIDQLQETAKFKEQLEEKNEQIARLNQVILLNRRKAEQAINQASIQKLKFISEMKQKEQTYEIKFLTLENEISSTKHALETMTAKLQMAVREVKTKDEFLQQHLVGRLKSGEEQEYVRNFLKKYSIEFPQNTLMEKLLEEQKVIRELRQRLGDVQ